jgi:hypothetical protein
LEAEIITLYTSLSRYAFAPAPDPNALLIGASELTGASDINEIEKGVAGLCNKYAADAELIQGKVRANLWRAPAWGSVSVRRDFPLMRALTLFAACRNRPAEFEAALPPELASSLRTLAETDESALKLIPGDKAVKEKYREFSRLWEAYGNDPDCHPDLAAENLLRAIPEAALSAYPEAAYEAAAAALKTVYEDEIKEAESEAERLTANRVPADENILRVTETLPTFRQLAADKIHVWKEVNVSPHVAKAKLVCGAKLTDEELTRLVEEVKAVRDGSKTMFGGKYREDVAQRVYAERVQARRKCKSAKTVPIVSQAPQRNRGGIPNQGGTGNPGYTKTPGQLPGGSLPKRAERSNPKPPELREQAENTSKIGLGGIVLAIVAFIAAYNIFGLVPAIIAAIIALIISARV